jgi:ATP-dependent RNA helicase DDX10/DBP4
VTKICLMNLPYHNSIWQALEKLYRERWGPEDGVGCIVLSPNKDLAGQIFNVFQKVGKLHGFSAACIVGNRKGLDEEKAVINNMNILVCTPGRLLQHMGETTNFDCSQIQVTIHILFYKTGELQMLIYR